jgi:glucose/mannose transport system permease protein
MRAGVLPKLLLSPSVLLVLVCVYGYIMFTIYLSFTTSTLMPSYEWAGTASYERLFALENWRVALSNLWVFALLYIGIAIALGLGFAILIDQHIRAEGAFRSIFLYPMALSFIVTGTCVEVAPGSRRRPRAYAARPGLAELYVRLDQRQRHGDLLRGHRRGLANHRLRHGVVSRGIAGSGCGTDQRRACRRRARMADLPVHHHSQLGPVFVSAFVILAHMAIKSYDLIIALTNGGPGRSTWLPSVFMYQYSFTRNEMAVGAASAVMMLAGIGLVVLPYLYSEMRKVKNA